MLLTQLHFEMWSIRGMTSSHFHLPFNPFSVSIPKSCRRYPFASLNIGQLPVALMGNADAAAAGVLSSLLVKSRPAHSGSFSRA